MPDISLFSDSYPAARNLFRKMASKHGGELFAYVHPSETDHAREPLTIDVARFGSEHSDKLLLINTGTHGLEAYFGSAAILDGLKLGLFEPLFNEAMVVLIHGFNPWGFDRLSRATENNVDMNRNFMNWNEPLPDNPAYRNLHPVACPEDWSSQALAENQKKIFAWIEENGMQTFLGALSAGQYIEPKGVIYGGRQPEWPQKALKQILAEHCSEAKKVAMIDWHTGHGDPGDSFFMCFNHPGDGLFERCVDWWGHEEIIGKQEDGYQGEERPDYTGLVFYGVSTLLSHADVAGAVVEIGTKQAGEIIDAICLDRALKFANHSLSEDEISDMKAHLLDAFCPSDREWRISALKHAERIHRQAVRGLLGWN